MFPRQENLYEICWVTRYLCGCRRHVDVRCFLFGIDPSFSLCQGSVSPPSPPHNPQLAKMFQHECCFLRECSLNTALALDPTPRIGSGPPGVCSVKILFFSQGTLVRKYSNVWPYSLHPPRLCLTPPPSDPDAPESLSLWEAWMPLAWVLLHVLMSAHMKACSLEGGVPSFPLQTSTMRWGRW